MASGIRKLWTGAGLLVARGATLSAAQLSTYDATKTACVARGWAADGPALHVGASLLAATVAVTVCLPLDVTLTRFQTAPTVGGAAFAHPVACARAMLRAEGVGVFFRGWSAMLVRMAPSSAASFFLYEQVRRVLGLDYLD